MPRVNCLSLTPTGISGNSRSEILRRFVRLREAPFGLKFALDEFAYAAVANAWPRRAFQAHGSSSATRRA